MEIASLRQFVNIAVATAVSAAAVPAWAQAPGPGEATAKTLMGATTLKMDGKFIEAVGGQEMIVFLRWPPTREGGMLVGQLLQVYSNGPMIDTRPVNRVASVQLVDCATGRSKSLGLSAYDADGGQVTAQPAEPTMITPGAGSSRDYILGAMCGEAPAADEIYASRAAAETTAVAAFDAARTRKTIEQMKARP